MITPQDLRIGNYVWNSTQCIPVLVDIKIIQEQINASKGFGVPWEPIPITEEILLKCGFECYAESGVSKGFSIGVNPVTNDYMVTLTWLKSIFNNNLDNYPFYRNGHHVLKYLHQLQNLYYTLTGKELEIKL